MVVQFIDAEHALDPSWCKKIGLNLNDLLISQADNAEQALDIIQASNRSGLVDLVVLDSVAAIVPKAELEGDAGDSHMGLTARLMSQACRRLVKVSSDNNVTNLFINQIRDTMATGNFVAKSKSTGGRALPFYASVRMDMARISNIKKGEEVIGSEFKVKFIKNKIAPPFTEAKFDILYSEGIDLMSPVIDEMVEAKLVTKAGSWYSIGEERIGQGKDSIKAYFNENPKKLEELKKSLKKSLPT